ncbi:MAG: TonB-dependent receptor, partial [Parabacteroides sp.]|nr:TonB-dependent receptor [Parabacteroides sp.]
GYSAFNYYGYHDALEHWTNSSFAYVIPAQEGFDRETNQVNQTIAASFGIESKEGADLAYLVDLGFVNFSHKYGISKETDGPKENTFEAKFDVSKGFNETMRFGLGGLVEYFNYSLPAEKTMPDGSLYFCEFENHAEVMLSPYYKVGGENWNVKLGANVMLKTGEEDLFMASPNVAINAEVADKTELYLNANGKLYSNSMYEMAKINRYLDPTRELRPSQNWLDAIVGIKSGVAPGFWFDVFAGYKMTSDDVLFVPQFPDLENGFGNFSQAMDNINTTLLFVGANLKYNYQQLFELSLRGVYNSWKAKYGDDWIGVGEDKELAHAWGKPEMELNAGITVRPIDKLAVALDYYLATGRYTQLYGAYEYKMNNINELNLTATYTLNDTFGFYVKANNLLAQKYELYYGYPMQRLSAQVGVNINF